MTDIDYLKRATDVGNRQAEPRNFGAGIDRIVYAVAANEQGFSYEFRDINIEDLAKKLTLKKISVEHIPIDRNNVGARSV